MVTFKGNYFPGVDVDKEVASDKGLFLIIDTDEYPTTGDQVGVINSIELLLGDTPVFYSTNGVGYFTAKEFRVNKGYDNEFFENK